ncbi:MAG: dephospho-CoA kinase [Thermoleophilaceae bacterium]
MGGPALRVPFVGLTGGLGAGKSTALAAAAELGAAVRSTDDVVHELLATDELRALIVERLGREVAPDGAVDRDAVAARVFERSEEREWLEGLLWPRVGRRLAEWRTWVEATERPPPVAVVETPLLFEAGMEDFYDFTIAVVASERVRAARAAARGHTAVRERAGRQLSQDEKAARASHVVHNDGTPEELREQLALVLESIAAR